jgi:hypothetical protein
MKEYVDDYNRTRLHPGIEQRCPLSIELACEEGALQRRTVLGGIIHDYCREAAWPAIQG